MTRVDFPAPLSPGAQKASPEFFALLDFLLQYAPAHPSETALRERFAGAGIGADGPLEVASLPASQRQTSTDLQGQE